MKEVHLKEIEDILIDYPTAEILIDTKSGGWDIKERWLVTRDFIQPGKRFWLEKRYPNFSKKRIHYKCYSLKEVLDFVCGTYKFVISVRKH